MQILLSVKRSSLFALSVLLLIALFFGIYELKKAPPTWFDEGFIVQSAMNLVDTGKLGIKISPTEVVGSSVWFSTGYPLAYPIGLVIKFFGRNLIYARSVMVAFLLLFVLSAYFLAKDLWGEKIAFFSTLLIVTFAPLYANGKAVLGEVPGLFFLFLFLLLAAKIEKKPDRSLNYILAGSFFGLCVFTKSLFLVLPAVVVLAYMLKRKEIVFNKKGSAFFIFCFILAATAWYATQIYEGDNFARIFGDLSNPYAVQDTGQLILVNAKRFFTETSPAHFLILLCIWGASLFVRRYKLKIKISFVELTISAFVLFIWLAYFRIEGWYRYFFPAQIILVFCLPAALSYIFDFFRSFKFTNLKISYLYMILILIAGLQTYHLLFNSWIAEYYVGGRQPEKLETYLKDFDKNKIVFLFNSPEVLMFLPNENYYQYMKVTNNIVIGEKELAAIQQGIPDTVVMNKKYWEDNKDLFLSSPYIEKATVGKYLFLEK